MHFNDLPVLPVQQNHANQNLHNQSDLFILKQERTFLVLTKSPSLFLAFALGDFLKSVAPYLLITFSLTTLLYIKEAPLNCGNTNHTTSASFMSYQIGILQHTITMLVNSHTHTHTHKTKETEYQFS